MHEIPITFVIAGALALALLLRRGVPSVLGFGAVYYIYFSFGPAIIYYADLDDIYSGIVVEWIPDALMGFTIAIFGWFVADVVWNALRPRKDDPDQQTRWSTPWKSWTYEWLMLGLTVYGTLIGGRVFLTGVSQNKLAAISAAGPLHYQYLLVTVIALSWSSAAWTARGMSRRIVIAAWGSFLLYCLATTERDFLLIAFVLGMQVAGRRRSRGAILGFVATGLVGLLAGTAIFQTRGGESTDLSISTVLNQGSTLFVDTYMYQWIANGHLYPEHSWLSALTRTRPTEAGLLSEWFVEAFLGRTDGGEGSAYGFSLSMEAYMNAGYFGVFGLFFVLGLIQLWLVHKGTTSPLWSGVSIAFMTQVLSALRGELYAIVTATLVIAAMTVLFHFGNRPLLRIKEEHDPHGLAEATEKEPARDLKQLWKRRLGLSS
ncbi:MAG: O-antigen polysaccharide polymerase Wzy [Propionibacteriaceae bacterium]|nr:O-antigen polysaccharide polymerase Wzy [Propionibacteriaceae bacterium]